MGAIDHVDFLCLTVSDCLWCSCSIVSDVHNLFQCPKAKFSIHKLNSMFKTPLNVEKVSWMSKTIFSVQQCCPLLRTLCRTGTMCRTGNWQNALLALVHQAIEEKYILDTRLDWDFVYCRAFCRNTVLLLDRQILSAMNLAKEEADDRPIFDWFYMGTGLSLCSSICSCRPENTYRFSLMSAERYLVVSENYLCDPCCASNTFTVDACAWDWDWEFLKKNWMSNKVFECWVTFLNVE